MMMMIIALMGMGNGDDNNNGPLIFIIVMMTTIMEFISDFNFKIVCVINVCDFALFNAASGPIFQIYLEP